MYPEETYFHTHYTMNNDAKAYFTNVTSNKLKIITIGYASVNLEFPIVKDSELDSHQNTCKNLSEN